MNIVSWIVVVATLAIGAALTIWFGSGNKSVALWIGVSGVVLGVLAVAVQIQQGILLDAKTTEQTPAQTPAHIETARPYVSIAAVGFPTISKLKAGPLRINWVIKNGPTGTTARIIEANVTLHYATEDAPLPDFPVYIPSTHHTLNGFIMTPSETFPSEFVATKPISPVTLLMINQGLMKLFVYGYVKYKSSAPDASTRYTRGFIAVYNPDADPRTGVFSYYEHPNYNYENEEQQK